MSPAVPCTMGVTLCYLHRQNRETTSFTFRGRSEDEEQILFVTLGEEDQKAVRFLLRSC